MLKLVSFVILTFSLSCLNTFALEKDRIMEKTNKSILDSIQSVVESNIDQSKKLYFEEAATLTGKLWKSKYQDFAGNWWGFYVLELEEPIIVYSRDYDLQDSITNCKEVQINLQSDIINQLLEKDKITLIGILYSEMTVHDRRPVIMGDVTILDNDK